MKKIKIGILGSGKIVSWFLNDLKALKKNNVELSGIYSTNWKKANEYKEKYSIKKVFKTYEKFLEISFDAVYIGTPDIFHYRQSIDLLKNGINVYCEKPITWTLKEAKRLYSLARKKHLLFFDGIKTGFSPAYIAMKKDIQDDIIGSIILIHSTHTKVSTSLNKPDPQPNIKTSGFHLAGGMYAAFLALDLAGPIKNYKYMTNPYSKNTAIATSAILARHKSKVISTIVGSDQTTDNLTAVIQGTKGYITLGGKLDKYNISYKKDSCHMAHTYEVRDLKNDLIKKYDKFFISNGEGLKFTISHFLELLKNNEKESSIVTKNISLEIIKLLTKTNKIA